MTFGNLIGQWLTGALLLFGLGQLGWKWLPRSFARGGGFDGELLLVCYALLIPPLTLCVGGLLASPRPGASGTSARQQWWSMSLLLQPLAWLIPVLLAFPDGAPAWVLVGLSIFGALLAFNWVLFFFIDEELGWRKPGLLALGLLVISPEAMYLLMAFGLAKYK